MQRCICIYRCRGTIRERKDSVFMSAQGTRLWQGRISVGPCADAAPAVPEHRTWGWLVLDNGVVGPVVSHFVSEPWLKRSCVRRVPGNRGMCWFKRASTFPWLWWPGDSVCWDSSCSSSGQAHQEMAKEDSSKDWMSKASVEWPRWEEL